MGFGSESDDREMEERPRPRVVDKRVSAGGTQTPSPARQDQAVPAAPPPADPAGAGGSAGSAAPVEARPPQQEVQPPGGEVWTPEQEAEAMEMARHVLETPSAQWVVDSAVNLANIAATKLDMGAPGDSSLAIDALAGILKEVGHRLGDVEAPLKQTLAQLQLAYTERVMSPGAPPAGPVG